MQLARTHRLTFYDALYLELAVRRSAQLATLDRNLAAAASNEGVLMAA
ncbi:MAG: type II toxin-antitoxin system VapC family toxin [Chloroflexi bacterium]|nr:type II toxin-antitoxin system VapC family toxin [Chloroflexota bacterium]